MPPLPRRYRPGRWRTAAAVSTGAAAALVAGLLALTTTAQTAAVFSASFEDGSLNGWSKSGGTWSVVTDGTKAARQSKADTDNARLFAGDSGWLDYTVQARVKPLSLGSGGLVGTSSPTPTPSTASPAPSRTASPTPTPTGGAPGSTLYVAPGGSDGNAGTLAAPLATIQKAVGLVSAAGRSPSRPSPVATAAAPLGDPPAVCGRSGPAARYWGHANVSDWQPGSSWEHRRADGSRVVDVIGQVIEAEPPTRLVITFDDAPDPEAPREPSVVTFLVEPHHDIVRLTVTHEKLANLAMLKGISHGWPAVLANLKSLLETGEILPQAPWERYRSHV